MSPILQTIAQLKHTLNQNARKYNILHIATHGFFFADPNEVRFEEKNRMSNTIR